MSTDLTSADENESHATASSTLERRDDIRNLVIIAHVDHGKTTLVDCLLRASGQFRESQLRGEQILDNNDLERERGITILAKNIALPYKGIKVNIIDTPGHADFGGEVERVLRMADGALVLVDAAEGPMPQTRFVLAKALECDLKPIVVINKIDKPDARPHEALDETMELILDLGGEDHFEELTYLFASSKEGFASFDSEVRTDSMAPLLDTIIEKIPGPMIESKQPLQMLVTSLDWSDYVGRIAIGRISAGSIKRSQQITISKSEDTVTNAKVGSVHVFENLGRIEVDQADAGEIVAIVGLDNVDIGDTICERDAVRALPRLQVDQPTLEMLFTINSSPLAGRVGKFVTGRQLRERLYKELERNVALRVSPAEGQDAFRVAGRGVLHLSILIETMRREGYELSVGKPRVITRKNDGEVQEPFELLVVEVPSDRLGAVMELVGERRGTSSSLHARGEYMHATFAIPARGLIGLRTRLLNATQGTAIIHHRFLEYRKVEGDIPHRPNGVLISNISGKAVGYALDGLQQRSELFVSPGDEVYEGMVVGENSRDNDLVVNPTREKKLTNIRAAGSDDNIVLRPAKQFSLEAALEYIEDDEMVEITPSSIRIRKVFLQEQVRRRK